MLSGKKCGHRVFAQFGLSWFIRDEGGYTSLATACALLVSLSLVFACASAAWIHARASEVQRVADAGALAAQNVVASYSTVAQVIDACVLSMGLCGIVVGGAGLVLSAVPGLHATGAATLEHAQTILSQRRGFARSSAQGLEKLEATLPFAMAANSFSVISSNSKGLTTYAGIALPFPSESNTDFDLDDGFQLDDLAEKNEALGTESDKLKDAQDQADKALHDGWYYDCGKKPYSLWQRTDTLSQVSAVQNPYFASPEGWNFGEPLKRARNYYAARLSGEAPTSSTPEELTRSASRKAFYAYALMQTNKSSYKQNPDGTVSCNLLTLPKNKQETMQTSLYTDQIWPLSQGSSRPRLHSSVDCPNFGTSSMGTGALSGLDSGRYEPCEVCKMSVADVGRVPQASTAIDNGFEFHWKAICEASERYEQAQNEVARAEANLKSLANSAADAFDQAISALKVSRPRLCPPGAQGAIAFCSRASEQNQPTQLVGKFLSQSTLPPGAAIAGAVLAPETTSSSSSVPSNLFDSFLDDVHTHGDGLLTERVLDFWSSALQAYGAGFGAVSDVTNSFFDGLDSFGLSFIADGLREKLSKTVDALGLEPADLRSRKPVLVHTQKILTASGYEDSAQLRSLLEALPTQGSAQDMAQALGRWVKNEYGEQTITIAELPIPGTPLSIPLTLDLGELLEAS